MPLRPQARRRRRLPTLRPFVALVVLGLLGALLAGQLGFTLWPQNRPAAVASDDSVSDGAGEVETGSPTPEAGESAFANIALPPPTPTPGRLKPAAHLVESGDTLLEIADKFGLRPESLLWANDLKDPDLIVVGQKLIVPPVDGLLYTVESVAVSYTHLTLPTICSV